MFGYEKIDEYTYLIKFYGYPKGGKLVDQIFTGITYNPKRKRFNIDSHWGELYYKHTTILQKQLYKMDFKNIEIKETEITTFLNLYTSTLTERYFEKYNTYYNEEKKRCKN